MLGTYVWNTKAAYFLRNFSSRSAKGEIVNIEFKEMQSSAFKTNNYEDFRKLQFNCIPQFEMIIKVMFKKQTIFMLLRLKGTHTVPEYFVIYHQR